MDQDHAKDWRELCKAAANELDPKKLMALIAEITRALDERDERRKISSENERMTSRAFSSEYCGLSIRSDADRLEEERDGA